MTYDELGDIDLINISGKSYIVEDGVDVRNFTFNTYGEYNAFVIGTKNSKDYYDSSEISEVEEFAATSFTISLLEDNPKTVDNIAMYIIIGFISLLGLCSFIKYRKQIKLFK